MAIYKRGSTWWADFVVNDRRYRASLDTADRREALKREKTEIHRAADGKLAAPGTPFVRLKFADAVAQFLEERKPRLKPRTVQTENERSKILTKRLGAVPIKKITAETILAYIRSRKSDGVANGTINRELDIVRGMLKLGKLWSLIADDVRPLPARSKFGRALTFEEKLRLQKLAKERPEWQTVRLAMTIALNTTMRALEIRSLQWRDVDLSDRSLVINSSKTAAGERIIPLNSAAIAAIMELRECAKHIGEPVDPDWYLFPREGGLKKPDPTRFALSWRRAWRNLTTSIRCPECGILQKPAARCWDRKCAADISQIVSPTAGFRFHDLRHHSITELAEGGATEQTIMAIAGHISRKMLERYSHVRLAAKRSALENLAGRGYVTSMAQRVQSTAGEEPEVPE